MKNKKVIYGLATGLGIVCAVGKGVMVVTKSKEKSRERAARTELVGKWSTHSNLSGSTVEEYDDGSYSNVSMTGTGNGNTTFSPDGTYSQNGTLAVNMVYTDGPMEGVEYSVKCRLTEKGNWEVIGDEIRFEPTNVKKKFISGNTNLSDRRLSRQVVNDLRESFTMITDDDYESYSETIISSSNKKITTKYSYDEISGTSVYKR